ncbi:MAG: class I SAM-dependent methyltransferase [Verrucomicrobiae bacterium]|nr:class I SAM-dependent methyltransferase [Verrucomicrobiae bacterium]
MSGPSRLRLHLSPAAVRAVRHGHPWIYPDRIRTHNRPGDIGDLAALYDPQDRFLGLGFFDPESPIRVRVLHAGPRVTLDDAWWSRHLDQALERRLPFFDPALTTGWRCLHGENDGWPGLVLDRYHDRFVLKLYSTVWLPRLEPVVALLVHRLHPRSLILRLSRNIAPLARDRFHRRDGDTLAGEPVTEPVVFLEHGLRFEADPVRGQKTGFFLDQRDNRHLVGSLAAGAAVLNAFSFSGGFSLHAARGGALSITDLDISPHALAAARRNLALNQHLPEVSAARHETVQADTFDWLAQSTARSFDLVILDPPSMARRSDERDGALAAYARLARLGAPRVRPRGWFVAASCSAHVAAPDFFETVRRETRRSGLRFTEWRTTGHPLDHPATFPEAHYLKAIYLRRL